MSDVLQQRRVGRPAREEDRKQIPTFFPLNVRDAVKSKAKAAGMSMSDWLDAQLLLWLVDHQHTPAYVSRTHPRKDASGTEWRAVQIVLLQDTYDRLQAYTQKYGLSIAGLVYTVAREVVGMAPILDHDHF
jgi:hypothetical protein